MSTPLYEKAVEAIQAMNGDLSIGLEESLENLQGLKSEIAMLIDAIEHDIRQREKEGDL